MEIWQLPNTILSWLVTRLIPKSEIIDIIYENGAEVYITDFWITNVTLGRLVVSQPEKLEHELKHWKVCKVMGWLYHAGYYNLIYSFTTGNGLYILLSIFGALLWFIGNELLVGNNVFRND